MKNNYIKSERMFKVCKRYVLRMFYVISILFTFGVGQAWGGDNCDFLHKEADDVWIKYVTDAGTTQKNLADDGESDISLGSKTNLSISEFRAIIKKHDGNVCHVKMNYGINTSRDGSKGSNVQAGYNNDGYGNWTWDNWWAVEQYKNTSVGIDLIRNRKPGSYYFDFYFAINGNSGGTSGCYDNQKYWNNNGGNYHISYTIPDPTITITGTSSLVAGTLTNITATISDYPVGATLTNLSVSGNIASTKSNTGSGSSITVSSVTPNASGANGITVTVTVTYGSAGTKTYTYYYNVSPPATSDFTITPSGSGYLSSGSGTEGSPYLVTHDGTITFGLSSATQASTDANSSPQYSTDGSNYGTSGTYISQSHTNVTQTTNQNWTYKARLKNNSSALYGSVKEKTVYWKVSTSSVTLNDNNGGSHNGSATATHGKNSLSSISAPTKTGYNVEGYYTNDATPVLIATANGTLQASTAYTNSSSLWNVTSNQTLYAHWTAHTYNVTLSHGEGGSGSGTATIDYDAGSFTTFVDGSITQTGYHIKGWYVPSTSTKVLNSDHSFAANNVSGYITSSKWSKAEDCTLQAWWDPNNYTVTFDLDEDHKGTIAGATGSQNVTFNTATVTVPNLPTAEDSYGLEGYYTDHNGTGTKLINYDGTWIASVAGYTDANKKWIHDGNVTLYAYYKQAEITSLVLTPSTQAPGESVTATPTIYPAPVGDKMLCWKLLRANGNPMDPQPTEWAPGEGNAVSFDAPATSGSYKVACILRTGSSCSGGTVLDSVVADLVVAGEHTVTIQYQDGSGRTLAASSEREGIKPLEWSKGITPATITGYTFDHWVAGDGVTISTDSTSAIDGSTTTTSKIYLKATYDGTLTAVYNKKNVIYFNNTLGWTDVWVYFYNSDKYWSDGYGTGAWKGQLFSGNRPYWEMERGHMTQIEGTDIWYFDYTAAGYSTRANVAFTNMGDQSGDNPDNHEAQAPDNDHAYFSNTTANPIQVIRRGDHKTSMPMFVPLTGQTKQKKNSDKAEYMSDGYWMNYPENTGYTLKIYNSATYNTSDLIRSIPFEFTPDKTLPMELTIELNASRTYGFEIHRADGSVLGKTTTITSSDNGYESGKDLTDNQRVGITTTVAGEYIFKLSYGLDGSSKYKYLVGVKYPAAVGDYRIVYNDRVAWSQSSAHGASWYHPSRTIHKQNGAEDIVSFYISKAGGASASMKFQYADAINAGTGVVTWLDVESGGISAVDTISKSGVYNFHLTQTAGTIRVSKVEPYTGNYYIRTDCAGSTKWENYRATDHQMTYSEFSKSRSTNKFGELFTHYYMHWCPRGMNVKFVIANDYSMCITDTLIKDIDDPYQNIYENDLGGRADGELKAVSYSGTTPSSDETSDKYSANIRFMYNESTNKISRAYMSSSTNTTRKFLILRSNTEFWNGDGTNISGTGETRDGTNNIYEVIFQDDEDWIYEREIKVTPSAKFKLYASYAQDSPSENGSQYFRGAYASNNWTNSANYIEIIGGTGDPCKVRVVYDFKTNRLIAAYLPDNAEIDGTLDINADIMVIREHQEAGQQITFANPASALTDVKTVYGVMRFNRWILNNRQHPEDHIKEHGDTDAHIAEFHPLVGAGSMKSVYERALYWISFPFDVNLSEVFGFGTYGTHWIMMDYNGAERARIGYWKDNDEGFWTYIEDRRGVTLKAGRGYVLALELELMKANDNTFWNNQIQQVELFFPSTSSTTGTISQTTVNVTVPDHECTIDRRTDKSTPDWNNDRRIADSHWNIIGVPSYANYGSTLSNGSSNITWQVNPKADGLPFLYEWNANDNTYTVQSGTKYNFKAMHAYYVQYAGTLRWTLASATPSIVARRTYAEESENVEFKLELTQNDKMIDQTFVKLSNDEEASTNFAFGEDLDKEFNDGKANVYTFIEGYIPSAGNTMPMTDQTTLVPVGVKITKAGEYTFAIPDGTSGVGVTLIDNVANTRTNLSALDYTVNLMAGTIDNRFVLEISPIHNATTGIEEVTGDGLPVTGARKVLIDGILYIVKDGKMYDVRGTMIK